MFLFSSCLAQAASSVCHPQEFGGKSDGKTLNTNAIQQAIQQCSQRGGGTVQLSPGLWLSGPLNLQNNITLKIEKGATLKASNQEGKFISAFIGHPARVNEAFIFADSVKNVSITGGGTLDGNGEKTWWPEALKIRGEVRGGNKKNFHRPLSRHSSGKRCSAPLVCRTQ
ncbi:glycosyl hydrolase family 28 protein [Pantoea tagorei]